MSIGSCLVANEPTDIGKAMIKRRAEGASWKEIGDEFGLPNPSAARKAFTKHTGIEDYKTKGPSIYDVKPGKIAKAQTDNVVKDAAKQADLAAKPNTVANAPSPPQAQPLSAMGDKHQQIIEEYQKGKGYVAIKEATGADFSEIDSSVWKHIYEQSQKDYPQNHAVWQAYKKKPTSENGFNAVKVQVHDLKAAGYSTKEIHDVTFIPDSVIDAIGNNSWSMPPMGGTSPVIPLPAPRPPATYLYNGPLPDVANRGYNFPDNATLQQWIADLGGDLSSDEYAAIKSYTGGGYHDINTRARGGRASTQVEAMDRGMRPIPHDVRVRRDTGYQAVFPGIDPESLVGQVIKDDGFFSSTIKERGVFGGDLTFIVDVPQGTMSRYVQDTISSHNEYELILGRQTNMLVTKVETSSAPRKTTIFAQVLL